VTFLQAFYTEFVPIFLFAVMMAMGLALTVADLKAVIAKPRALLAGLGAQIILMPIIAIGLGLLYASPPVIAAGAIILAACPGGVTSNAYVFSARADIALSIGLTAVASMITVFSIPFLTLFALDLHMGQTQIPSFSARQMFWTLAQFTIVPVTLGMLFRAWQPRLAIRVLDPLRVIALLSLIMIAVVGTVSAWDTIVENIWTAGILMATINLVAMSLGYGIGKLLRLPFKQLATITFEVGVQNLSMAFFVCLTFLQSPELAVATFVYALMMKITALSLVWYVRRRLIGEEKAAAAV
jgi:BASS family bile acid:Na+ symporter